MRGYIRIECSECDTALRVEHGTLPPGFQPDELFEEHCPKCERVVFMRLAQTLEQK